MLDPVCGFRFPPHLPSNCSIERFWEVCGYKDSSAYYSFRQFTVRHDCSHSDGAQNPSILDSTSDAMRVRSIDFAKAFDKIPHLDILKTNCKFKLPASRNQRQVFQKAKYKRRCPTVQHNHLFFMLVDHLHSIPDHSLTKVCGLCDNFAFRTQSYRRQSSARERECSTSVFQSLAAYIIESKCRALDAATKKSLVITLVGGPDGHFLTQASSLTLLVWLSLLILNWVFILSLFWGKPANVFTFNVI